MTHTSHLGEKVQTVRNVLFAQHLEEVWSTPGLEEQEKCECKVVIFALGGGLIDLMASKTKQEPQS